ncbi:MAG: cyclic pyranopterin monophosphate synthase MoaC [Pyrobaculum sp.]
MIVDVSKKPDVVRYAKASAELDVAHCNTAVAVRAALNAYRFLPFLHPLPLRAVSTCNGGRLYVEGLTKWQTGVEMDVLFGALVGAVASSTREIKNLVVDVKIKDADVELAEMPAVEVPVAREGDLEASARGVMELRNPHLVDSVVDKGHPLHSAKAAASLSAKRLCELVGGDCPKIQLFKIDIVVGDVVIIDVFTKARDLSPAPEALFSAGVALLTIWDMIKKYEKDERGQYPHTKIAYLRLEPS